MNKPLRIAVTITNNVFEATERFVKRQGPSADFRRKRLLVSYRRLTYVPTLVARSGAEAMSIGVVEFWLGILLPLRRRAEIIGDLVETYVEERKSTWWLLGQALYMIGAAFCLRAVDALKRVKGRPPNS